MLRFLRARKFDWEKTRIMFETHLKWRKDIGIDEWLHTYISHEHLPAVVHDLYPHNYHKFDREGHPIYIERVGMVNVDEILKVTNEDAV